MMRGRSEANGSAWQKFVLAHGWRASAYELAAVLGRSAEDIVRLRSTGACTRLAKGKEFAELFALWHGRPPQDDDWPVPRKLGERRTYEWHSPELAFLASLVGRLGVPEIAQVLTNRLRERTGDPRAERSPISVQVRINKIGLQTRDVVGGITTAQAAREVGSLAIINQMIHKRQIPAIRIGRLWVIPHEAWEAWKAKRVFPPEGYVQLSTLRSPLGIRSDKLSEYARMGLLPTAMRCNPYGTKGPSTQFGTWWIDQKVAAKLLADRRAGRPMPWQGQYADNLRRSFALWQERRHPASCRTCADIWGKEGSPRTYEEYALRYPPLAHGAKRHLTRPWTPGLTVAEVAAQAGRNVDHVRKAIRNGALAARFEGRRQYISRTDATRWCARHCPSGEGKKSWIGLKTACDLYLFTLRELRRFIGDGTLKSGVRTDGAAKGVVYVSRHQCGQLREKIGFSEEQAARRLGVTLARFRHLLQGVNWRKADKIPLVTVQAVRKRIESRHGYTVEEAAAELRKPVHWVRERIEDGTIRVSRAKWDRRRVYISEPMFRRLHEARKAKAVEGERFGPDWLHLSDAALEAGVTSATVIKWAQLREIGRRRSKTGWRYHREAVRARAREYWRSVRFHRATPPDWLLAESSGVRSVQPVHPAPHVMVKAAGRRAIA